MSIVQTAIDSTYQTLFFGNFIPWKFHPRSSDFEPSTVSKTFVASIALIQLQADSGNIFKAATADIDESYSLELSQNGNVTIIANSSIGIAHALTSFTQLFYAHSQGGGVYTPFMPISISDNPAFLHRGLNMDVSRNFFLVANIERTIDALAYNKFNRLHIHITDAQSWPIEIPSMPELAAKGAYGPGLTYSPSQLSQIQSYGALRGVQVYLEIDMPGHTSSIAFAFLDLIAAFNVQPNWYDYCAEPPCGTLKLNSSAVYDFLDALWGDILPRVSPYTSYFHTGGDEVNFDAYTLDETVHSSDPTVLHDLLQTFTDFNHDKIRAAGLTPIVWEEMLLNYNLTLGEDVVVQSWLGSASVASIVGKGYKALAGSHEFWYLDCGLGQWLDFTPGSSSQAYYPYTDWCSPTKNWHLIYSLDPLASIPPSQQHLVLGAEIHIWTEQTDPVNFDSIVWPRACAAGEVLWSGGVNRSQIEAAPRFYEMRERLVAKGVGAGGGRMPFCGMDGGGCVI